MASEERANRPEGPISRRSEIRRKLGVDRAWVRSPAVVQTTAVAAIFAIVAWVLCDWSRQQSRWVEGRILTEPLLNRVDYQLENEALTRQERELARRIAPRLYVVNRSYLESLRATIEGLPQAVAGKTSVSEVDASLIETFGLDDRSLLLLQAHQDERGPTTAWRVAAESFITSISGRMPLLARDEFQRFATAAGREVVISHGSQDQHTQSVPIGNAAIQLPDGDPSRFRESLLKIAAEAGFATEVAPIVVRALLSDPQPTLRFDEVATLARAEAAAAAVEPVMQAHPRGEVIGMPGDPITRERIQRLDEERAQTFARTPVVNRWTNSVGLLGLCALLAGALCVGLAIFRPTLLGDIAKLSLLLLGMLVMLLVAVVVSASFPRFEGLIAISVTLLAASSVALLYDRRTAIVTAAAQTSLLALALEEPLGFVLASLLTAVTYVALLRDVRHRSALVRATALTAGVGALAFAFVELVHTPLGGGGVMQVIGAAVFAAGGTFLTGFLLIGALPSMERTFGVVTGLTLAELRDPRQPLLRQLQEKAPGTWTHSLQVANIAEAAAEAIGADGLLTYVGALYHDIGKMNKPEYFVENQVGGQNRHDRLTPAMSLLVIIGHVKDGVELAAEYRLPKAIRHMIEAHHGTTLVEYFFHEAQRRASRDADEPVELDESAWRYPGPRPQTSEAAILLICDAVESATRTLAEPTPARIEQLVHTIIRRRLEDGQFDDCPLTFRQLRTLEESIAKSLGSIYHGRVAYPSTSGADDDGEGEPPEDTTGGPLHPRTQPSPGTRRAVA
ncbi:MAG: HDIG domain-containing protein [Phycisphaeraceae bacterium]|nr:HDIG domain-containing protein [Phycisphaeraceae bacterium]